MTTYADLEIRILKKDGPGYPVELTLDGGSTGRQQYQGGYLGADILPWVSSASAEKDGQRLFAALLADLKLREQWAAIHGQARQRQIRLRIDPTAPELHTLP